MARIISGTAKNTQLEAPEEGTRPITDRAKSALFSIIFDWIEGSNVLDLYAGSGSLGIEALSRGANSATFVDYDEESIQCIYRNLEKSKLKDKAIVILDSAENLIENEKIKKYDLIFLDPPYPETKMDQVTLAEKVLADPGIIILKHSPDFKVEETIGNLKLVDSRTYGENVISFYQKFSN